MTTLALAPRRHAALPPTLAPAGLSRIEAAAYIGISPSLFDVMVEDGRMPPAKLANARKIWIRSRLDVALASLPDAVEDRTEVNPWNRSR